MLDILSPTEAAAVLCLLMIDANGESKPEEVGSLLTNPFFKEHILEKIGHPADFLKSYRETVASIGLSGVEKKSVAALKGGYPTFQIKTLAMMTLIAGADQEYDQTEKELMARVATSLGIAMDEVGPELSKMKQAILEQEDSESTEEE